MGLSLVFSFLRFHLQLALRERKTAVILLTIATFLAVTTAILCLQQSHEASAAGSALAARKAAVAQSGRKVATLPVSTQGQELPEFNSAELVASMNELALDLKLPVDEINYALDSGGSDPYLRYRVTLRISSGYQGIRKFSEKLAGGLSNVALDSVSCNRQDTTTVPLTCDLAFSAYYRRGVHG